MKKRSGSRSKTPARKAAPKASPALRTAPADASTRSRSTSRRKAGSAAPGHPDVPAAPPGLAAPPARAAAAESLRDLRLPRAGQPGPKPYDWRPIFLKALRKEIGVVTPACEAACVSVSMAYEERKTNREFAAAWEAAVQAGVDDLEQHALKLARGEVKKGVFFEGRRVAEEPVQFEKTLHKALGKHRPEWRDRTEVTGKDGKPLVPENLLARDLESMSDEELNALRSRIDQLAATSAAAH